MKYALILAVLLSGCACFKKPEAPEPQVVKVPVAVPCEVQVPARPEYHFRPPYKSVYEGTRDLLGDRAAWKAYQEELEAALKACTK